MGWTCTSWKSPLSWTNTWSSDELILPRTSLQGFEGVEAFPYPSSWEENQIYIVEFFGPPEYIRKAKACSASVEKLPTNLREMGSDGKIETLWKFSESTRQIFSNGFSYKISPEFALGVSRIDFPCESRLASSRTIESEPQVPKSISNLKARTKQINWAIECFYHLTEAKFSWLRYFESLKILGFKVSKHLHNTGHASTTTSRINFLRPDQIIHFEIWQSACQNRIINLKLNHETSARKVSNRMT